MNTAKLDLPQFAFHVHKPKAASLAEQFRRGCRATGYDCKITKDHMPVKGHIGVFYGVVPETYACFRYYMSEARAIYLDNGWLSTKEYPTFRFSWNSAQAFLKDMEVATLKRIFYGPLPRLNYQPETDLALLVLQSRQYFENLRLPYSRDVWERATSRLLAHKGYRVITREKPTKKDPEAESFFDQISRAGIVVSLNSASCFTALRYRIPAFCTLDCTLSPYAPVRLPNIGRAAPPTKDEVQRLCATVGKYEFTRDMLTNGEAIQRFLAIHPEGRRGYWYNG